MEEKKPALILVILALTAVITVFAYSVFDSPKYNPIKTEFTSTEAEISAVSDEKININTADVSQLCELDGIGDKKAQLIIEYREENGFFRSVDELKCVSGINQKTLDDNSERITV